MHSQVLWCWKANWLNCSDNLITQYGLIPGFYSVTHKSEPHVTLARASWVSETIATMSKKKMTWKGVWTLHWEELNGHQTVQIQGVRSNVAPLGQKQACSPTGYFWPEIRALCRGGADSNRLLPVTGRVAAARLMLSVQQDLLHVSIVDWGWWRNVLQAPDHRLLFLNLRQR